MKRFTKKIKCEICALDFSSAYFGQHLIKTHNISSDEYVKKFGEYRVNRLKSLQILNSSDVQLKCLECNDTALFTDRSLTYHIKKRHNFDKNTYIIKHLLDNIVPKCKCGCGNDVSILNYTGEIYRNYISGHNSIGSLNPMFGKKQSDLSKNKMSQSAKKRIQIDKTTGVISPWHSRNSIKKRSEIYSNNLMEKKCKKFNIEFVNSIEERRGKNVYEFKCLKCNNTYTQYHNSYFICRKCNPSHRSKFEAELLEFVNSELKVNVVQNYRKAFNGTFEIDLYFPDFNIGIEFNGLYWHSEIGGGKDRNYHLNKTKSAWSKKIRLIHIFEDDWTENKDLIKSKIKHIFNKNPGNKYYARKCVIRTITDLEKREFLKNNHIQGNDTSKIKLGAFYHDKLISVMTFSIPNISKGYKSPQKNIYELSRFCSIKNDICIGLFSKMLKHFLKTYTVSKIITYADRCWSDVDNNIYIKNKFIFVKNTPPNYWYTNDYKNRLHRFQFTKQKLIKMGNDPSKTEREIMIGMKYDRVWDCGHLKYEYNVV
jgi:hypothetical protein